MTRAQAINQLTRSLMFIRAPTPKFTHGHSFKILFCGDLSTLNISQYTLRKFRTILDTNLPFPWNQTRRHIPANQLGNSGYYTYVSSWARPNLLRIDLQSHLYLLSLVCTARRNIYLPCKTSCAAVTKVIVATIPSPFNIAQDRATSSTSKQALWSIVQNACISIGSLNGVRCNRISALTTSLIILITSFGAVFLMLAKLISVLTSACRSSTSNGLQIFVKTQERFCTLLRKKRLPPSGVPDLGCHTRGVHICMWIQQSRSSEGSHYK